MAISRSGRLTALWQRKVVEGAGDAQADVVVRKLDVTAPPSPSVQALSRALGTLIIHPLAVYEVMRSRKIKTRREKSVERDKRHDDRII